MTKRRWFRFHIDRWFRGTAGLTSNEIAAYLTIMCELYDHDGIVALDVPRMAHSSGMRPTSFQKALDTLIARKKVALDSGLLTSDSVAEEIRQREKLVDKSAKTRQKVGAKPNEINGVFPFVPSYTEPRNKKDNLQRSALHPREALERIEPSPALLRTLPRPRNVIQ